MHQICNWAKYQNRHSPNIIRVIKLTFCQNDSTIWGSFWKKDSLITSILLEPRMSVYFGIFKPSCKFDAPPSRFTYQIECNKFKWICVDDMSIKLHLDNNLNVWVVKKITKHRRNAPLRLVTFSATQTLHILFPTYYEKKCSSDREKLLKFEAVDQEFGKLLRSLEQYI